MATPGLERTKVAAPARPASVVTRSHGREEGEAWLPFVVDCPVCETTHALAIGEGQGCPFEGSSRASLEPGLGLVSVQL